MPKIPELLDLLKAGAHFGHKTSRWHPAMAPYIFTERNGVHIINLEKTVECLKKALDFVSNTVAQGGVVLFLSTKMQAQTLIKKYAEDCGMPYINKRWLGGTITNFSIIYKLIKKYKDLKRKQEIGELKKYTKKEQLEFSQEIDRLTSMVGGIQDLERIPQAIFVADIKKDKTAVQEAVQIRVPVIGICDTNSNPRGISYLIPANDDAIKSLDMIISLVAEAVKEGKKLAEVKNEAKKQINVIKTENK